MIGQAIAAIETPTLVVDLDAMQRNGAAMAAFGRERGLWGELQCGSDLFVGRHCADNAALHGALRFEHALFVKSQVISRHPDRAIVDAGHKSHAVDSGLARVWGATTSSSSKVATS